MIENILLSYIVGSLFPTERFSLMIVLHYSTYIIYVILCDTKLFYNSLPNTTTYIVFTLALVS